MVLSQKKAININTSASPQIVNIADSAEDIKGRKASAPVAGSMLGAIAGCLVAMGVSTMPAFVPISALGTSGISVVITLFGAGIGLASGGLISLASLRSENVD